MDGLRWLLLGFGLLVIVAVYLYSRRQSRAVDEDLPELTDRVEPSLDGLANAPVADVPPVLADEPPPAEPQTNDDDVPSIRPSAQKIVTLRVVARGRDSFKGDELILCLRGIGMRHGKFGIFHRYETDDEGEAIFSAASLVEPGSFDLSNIKEQEIPGISLFAVLPGPVEGVDAFDMMMAAARAIAKSMEAELLDESGSTLSIQRERYMREEIIEFEHASQVAH